MLRIAWIAASLLLLCPAQTWSQQLKSMTSGFVTCITHFPIILRITSLTPIGKTAPSPLSRGMSRFTKIASIPRGSINSVHKHRVIAATAARRSVLDFLNDWCKNSPQPNSHQRLRDPQNLLFAEPHPVLFRHLSVGKLSVGHLRKSENPNGLPVDLDVSLWAVPWRHHLEARHLPHRFQWDNARPSWFAVT